MENVILTVYDLILKKWNDAKSIPVESLPDYQDTRLTRLIVNYDPAWFVALLDPSEQIVIIAYSKVNSANELPHLLLNYDHLTTSEYLKKYPSKYLLIEPSDQHGIYKTEFYDTNGNLFDARSCSVYDFLESIEMEFADI